MDDAREKVTAMIVKIMASPEEAVSLIQHLASLDWADIYTKRSNLLMSTEERFWKHVQKQPDDGCWIWNGATNGNGHGSFSLTTRKKVSIGQYSYELAYGNTDKKGSHIYRTCATPLCVRPDHLTYDSNLRGDNKLYREYHNVKLTYDQVVDIKSLLLADIPVKDIAKEYVVTRATIHSIKAGRTWTHVNL